MTYIGYFFDKAIIGFIIIKWEGKQYKETVFKIISRYNFNIGTISIFKLFSNN